MKTTPLTLIITLFTAVLLLIGLLFSGCDQAPKRIVILHHNDFHSAVSPYDVPSADGNKLVIQGAAGLKGLAKSVRDSSAPAIWLFAGDDFTGAPMSGLTKGSSQIQVSRRMGINVGTLGNHEFDHGQERARAYHDSVGFPVLGGANLLDSLNKPFTKPFHDVTIGGVKMRIIGLVPVELKEHTLPWSTGDLQVLDPAESVRKYLPRKNRLTVVLSHMGYSMDSLLATAVPEIDVIVGGHQHLVTYTPRLVGVKGQLGSELLAGDGKTRLPGTVITQAGSSGRFLGYLSLTVKGGDLVSVSGKMLSNDGKLAPPDPELKAFVELLEKEISAGMDKVIAKLTANMIHTRGDWENPLANWITDCFRKATGADIAFTNPGGIRKNLAMGDLTIRDIWEVAPFGNTLVQFEMTGGELYNAWNHIPFKARETLLVSGMMVTLNTKTQSATNLMVGREPLDIEKSYKVVTNSYVFGHFDEFFGVPLGDRKYYDTGLIDRAVLQAEAEQAGTVEGSTDPRIFVNK